MAKSTKPPATKSFVKSVASDPIARSVVAIVSACSRFPWTVLALATLVTIAAGYYTATHFAINTNTNEFISARLPWRQNLIALDKAFPACRSNCRSHRWRHPRDCRGGGAIADREIEAPPRSLPVGDAARGRPLFRSKRPSLSARCRSPAHPKWALPGAAVSDGACL